MKLTMKKIQPPIVHADYDDYDEEQLDEMINLMIQKTQSLYTCTVIKFSPTFVFILIIAYITQLISALIKIPCTRQACGKSTSGKSLGKRQNLRDHIEARHVQGVSHFCQKCGSLAKTRNSLRMHTHNYHKGVNS